MKSDRPSVRGDSLEGGRERRRGVHHEPSPGARSEGRSSKRRWSGDDPGRGTISRTSSRPVPRSSAGSVAASGSGSGWGAMRSITPPRAGRRSDSAPKAGHHRAAGQPGDAGLGKRPVADVLAGEGLLMHGGAHVTRIHPVDAQAGLLGGEHVAQLLERRLRCAVSAPSLVALHRGIRCDRNHRAAVAAQVGEGELGESQRSHQVDPSTCSAGRGRRGEAGGGNRESRRC